MKNILNIARQEIGLTDGTRYGAPAGAAWCAAFVSWCFEQAGITTPGLPGLWVPSVLNGQRAAGLAVADPEPEDLVFFDPDGNGAPNHIGIVEAVSGGSVHTIEGNSGTPGAVRQWTYPVHASYILAYTHPVTTAQEVFDMAMECIIQPDGMDLMVYYDGHTVHDLSNPDCVTAINMVYQQTHGGASIPCFKMGSKEAPWAARFFQAVLSKPPREGITGGLYDFEPRSGWED